MSEIMPDAFLEHVRAEIDAAQDALYREIMRGWFPVFYWVNTREEEQELEARLTVNCLLTAAGGDPYGRLPDPESDIKACSCDCMCDC